MKLVTVELFFYCRSDADARLLALLVAEKGHEMAERARAHIMLSPEEIDVKFSGSSWSEKEVVKVR